MEQNNMRLGKLCLKGLFLFLTLVMVAPSAVEAVSPVKVVESFSRYKVGQFPKALRTYPFQRGKAKEVYKIAEEGSNRFLRAVDEKDISVQVMRKFLWNVDEYPWISWRWRPQQLPTGGDERNAATNDSACGVYIVFGSYTGKALKYVWSTSAPQDYVVKKKPGQFHMIVKATGAPSNPGKWSQVAVNVVADYKAQFGEELNKQPSGFGLLTDGNAVHQPAACDYDDFAIAATNPSGS